MILNIEAWQKPDTVKIEEAQVLHENLAFKKQNTEIIKPYKGWTAPEFRSTIFLIFPEKNSGNLENKLYQLEQLKKQYMTAKPIEKIGICSEFREVASDYNLLVGFECLETELTKLNIPLTNNSGKIVLNFG